MASVVQNGRLNDSSTPKGQFREFPRASWLIEEVGSYTYVGKTGVGLSELTGSPIWQIIRILNDDGTGVSEVKWAAGADRFDNIWDNKETLVYR